MDTYASGGGKRKGVANLKYEELKRWFAQNKSEASVMVGTKYMVVGCARESAEVAIRVIETAIAAHGRMAIENSRPAEAALRRLMLMYELIQDEESRRYTQLQTEYWRQQAGRIKEVQKGFIK